MCEARCKDTAHHPGSAKLPFFLSFAVLTFKLIAISEVSTYVTLGEPLKADFYVSGESNFKALLLGFLWRSRPRETARIFQFHSVNYDARDAILATPLNKGRREDER